MAVMVGMVVVLAVVVGMVVVLVNEVCMLGRSNSNILNQKECTRQQFKLE